MILTFIEEIIQFLEGAICVPTSDNKVQRRLLFFVSLFLPRSHRTT